MPPVPITGWGKGWGEPALSVWRLIRAFASPILISIYARIFVAGANRWIIGHSFFPEPFKSFLYSTATYPVRRD